MLLYAASWPKILLFGNSKFEIRNSTIELTLKVLQSAYRTLAQARFFQQRASALLMKTYWKWQHSLRPVKRDHFFHWPLSQSPTKITFGSKKWVYLLAFRATNHSRYRNFLWCLSWRLDHQINGKFGIPVLLTIGTKLYIPSTLNIDLILWHTQNVKTWVKSWVISFTFQAYTLPHTLNFICVSLFTFHIWILKQF